ncbi:MAG: DUF58 domain-containing protein [Verrucomicrobiae bacterium]|nr:DUF58 domain-containing protein [Verrucomicrobiae bacterium]
MLPRDAILEIRRRMQALSAVFRLPFRSQSWRGLSGQWQGMNSGSSIDFLDHRPYYPGDDPRHINWQAYARTGHHTMKLYREETSPRADIILDASHSMFLTPQKSRRMMELFFLCFEGALQAKAAVHVILVAGDRIERVALEAVLNGSFLKSGPSPSAQSLANLHALVRGHSLRLLISDLLFPISPAAILPGLTQSRGRVCVLAPYGAEEEKPGWEGNLQFQDCESEVTRIQRVDATLLDQYQRVYRRHFELWKSECRRFGARMARLAAEPAMEEALLAEGVTSGAFELWT